MHYGLMPVRDIIRLTIVGQQFSLFFLLEYYQRQTPRSAVNTLSRHFKAPLLSLLTQVG